MKILVVNTASDCCFVGLILNDVVKSTVFSSYQKTSENLLPEIDKLLKKNKVSLSDLDAVAVCVGPGSFTGIRVGIATVKAICFALKTPLIAFNIFDCFENKGTLLTKANSGGAYGFKNGKMFFASKEEVKLLDKKSTAIFMQEQGYFNFSSAILEDVLSNTLKLCKREFEKKNFIALNQLIPQYVLKSQAEVELDDKIANLKVLKLKKDNLKQLVDIEKECFEKPYSSLILEDNLKNKNKFLFGLFLKDRLIGYVLYSVLDDEMELERVCIIKKYRNLDLANKLILKSIKKFKVKKCFLEVNKNNTYAIKLYIKLGFVEMGVRKNYYKEGQDALTMQKVF